MPGVGKAEVLEAHTGAFLSSPCLITVGCNKTGRAGVLFVAGEGQALHLRRITTQSPSRRGVRASSAGSKALGRRWSGCWTGEAGPLVFLPQGGSSAQVFISTPGQSHCGPLSGACVFTWWSESIDPCRACAHRRPPALSSPPAELPPQLPEAQGEDSSASPVLGCSYVHTCPPGRLGGSELSPLGRGLSHGLLYRPWPQKPQSCMLWGLALPSQGLWTLSRKPLADLPSV